MTAKLKDLEEALEATESEIRHLEQDLRIKKLNKDSLVQLIKAAKGD